MLSRSARSAAVVRLLTVPRGVSVRREISLCESPWKYARVSTSRWTGEIRERAEARSKLRESSPVASSSPGSKEVAAHGPNPGAAAADQVRRPVARDAVYPGREARPRRVEARSVPPHGSEHVLHEVFGERPVPEIPHTCSVYEAGVTVVQLRARAPLRPVPPALPEPRPRRLSLRASPQPSLQMISCAPPARPNPGTGGPNLPWTTTSIRNGIRLHRPFG